VTKTATLLGELRVTVSKVMLAYMKQWKPISAKKNSECKATLTERDHLRMKRIVSKNHTTTAAQVTAELNIHLDDPVSTKTVQHELQNSSIHDKSSIAKPLITGSNAHVRKRCCHDHKTWTPDNWKHIHDMVR
jgi:hypothetical protein